MVWLSLIVAIPFLTDTDISFTFYITDRWREMPYVKNHDNESVQNMLRRFKRCVDKAGILSDVRKNSYYDKPSVSKRQKSLKARKRLLKQKRRESRKN